MEAKQKREIRRQFNVALREREQRSREIRAKIRTSTGDDRYNAWDEKRSYGSDTRWIQLAYGFLKGIPYNAIEPNYREGNGAWPAVIALAAKDVTGLRLNGDALLAWLDGMPSDAPKVEVTIPLKVEAPKPVPVAAAEAPKPGFFARLFGRVAS